MARGAQIGTTEEALVQVVLVEILGELNEGLGESPSVDVCTG